MTKKIVGLTLAMASAFVPSAFSQYGGGYGGSGKCTVEVEVDNAADVLVTGSRAQIRTLSGGRGTVIRTNCNAPMPPQPASFRFKGIDGRGSQNLIADPNSNRGTAVVRIQDPRGGRERYTFDLIWNGSGGYNSGVYGNGYPNGNPVYGGNYPNNYPNSYPNNYPNNGYPNGGYPNGGNPVYGNYPNNNGTYGNNYPQQSRRKHRREPRYYDRWGNPVW